MSAASPAAAPAQKSGPPAAPLHRSVWLRIAAAATVAWVCALAAITWMTANPPVINLLQLQHSDLVLVGTWENRAEGRFLVERELKHGRLKGPVKIVGLPDRGLPTTPAWVIPVTKLGDTWAVTRGEFPILVRPPAKDARPQVVEVNVDPQCYPATNDVLGQIAAAGERIHAKAGR